MLVVLEEEKTREKKESKGASCNKCSLMREEGSVAKKIGFFGPARGREGKNGANVGSAGAQNGYVDL